MTKEDLKAVQKQYRDNYKGLVYSFNRRDVEAFTKAALNLYCTGHAGEDFAVRCILEMPVKDILIVGKTYWYEIYDESKQTDDQKKFLKAWHDKINGATGGDYVDLYEMDKLRTRFNYIPTPVKLASSQKHDVIARGAAAIGLFRVKGSKINEITAIRISAWIAQIAEHNARMHTIEY